MKNKKIINYDNLLFNLKKCQNYFPNICAMVKANAYGHNDISIVNFLQNHINYFGVANEIEALELRKKFDNINIIVVGKSSKYNLLIKNKIQFTIDSEQEIDEIKKICAKTSQIAYIHIAINTGMNRIGVKSIKQFKNILEKINQNKKLKLCGIFTHTFDSDSSSGHFYEQMQNFYQYVKIVNNPEILIHIGGSYVLNHKIPTFINMVRVGYYLYGYGKKILRPVMKITTKIIKIIDCKKSEYVGYGKNKLKANSKIAILPIGYADGLNRRLSNKYCVLIKNNKCKIVGNICMDMCMIDISNVECKIGDEVCILDNAQEMAKIVETSPYEILTGFNRLR